jgi:hypothetical protein
MTKQEINTSLSLVPQKTAQNVRNAISTFLMLRFDVTVNCYPSEKCVFYKAIDDEGFQIESGMIYYNGKTSKNTDVIFTKY